SDMSRGLSPGHGSFGHVPAGQRVPGTVPGTWLVRACPCRSAGDGIALHHPRIRAGSELGALAGDGADAAERPRREDADVVAAAAQLVDRVLAEPRLDVEGQRLHSARIEARDQVVGVPVGRVDRLLEVESLVD